jgi:hypothetical protein
MRGVGRNQPCWVVLLGLTAFLGCRTPSGDWNGDWKLDRSRGNFHGPTYEISRSADGEYRWQSGSGNFTFRCDGIDRPSTNGDTRSCVKTNDHALEIITKENGVKTRVSHWELSPDGKVFTATSTKFPSGEILAKTVTSRLSGADDFVGRWLNSTYLDERGEMTIKVDHAFHISYPLQGVYVDAPFSLTAYAPAHGPHALPDVAYTARPLGPFQILTASKRNEKILTEDLFRLSLDGKTITETWWNPDHPGNKGVLVYTKK